MIFWGTQAIAPCSAAVWLFAASPAQGHAQFLTGLFATIQRRFSAVGILLSTAQAIPFAFVGLPVTILKERDYRGRPLLSLLTNSRSQGFKRN